MSGWLESVQLHLADANHLQVLFLPFVSHSGLKNNGNLSTESGGKVAGGRGWKNGTGCIIPATC